MYFESASDDLAALRDSVRGRFAREESWWGQLRDGAAVTPDSVADCAAVVSSLGLLGALIPGEGTLAMGAVIAREAGRAMMAFPISEMMCAVPILLAARPDLAQPTLSGDLIVTTSLDHPLRVDIDSSPSILGGELAIPFFHAAHWLLALVDRGAGKVGTAIIRLADCKLEQLSEIALDAGFPATQVRLAVPLDRVFLGDGDPRLALSLLASAELIGCAEAVFERSIEHLNTREQFGRVLATKQALRHNAAENWVDISKMQIATDCAAELLDGCGLDGKQGAPEAAMAVHTAKMLCSAGARRLADDAIQYHGGLGYSWETGLHFYLRRIVRLSAVAGTPLGHARMLVDLLQRNGVPFEDVDAVDSTCREAVTTRLTV